VFVDRIRETSGFIAPMQFHAISLFSFLSFFPILSLFPENFIQSKHSKLSSVKNNEMQLPVVPTFFKRIG
jgi:hypothetical protein